MIDKAKPGMERKQRRTALSNRRWHETRRWATNDGDFAWKHKTNRLCVGDVLANAVENQATGAAVKSGEQANRQAGALTPWRARRTAWLKRRRGKRNDMITGIITCVSA